LVITVQSRLISLINSKLIKIEIKYWNNYNNNNNDNNNNHGPIQH